MKNSNAIMWNGTRDLPACSAVPQPAAPGRNIKQRLCTQYCHAKAKSTTYSENVSVALGIQHTVRIHHAVIHSLLRSTIFFPHYLVNVTILWKKLLKIKFGFRFSLHLPSETFFFLRTE